MNEPWALNLQQHMGELEIFDKPLLVCKIIKTWQEHKKVSLRTKEGKSFASNGLYDLLDVVCEQFNIPAEDIELMNNNWTEYHDRYKIQQTPFNFELSFFYKQNSFDGKYEGNKFYGLFIGRADRYRLRALILSNRRDIPKLTSFHHNFDNAPVYEEVGPFLLNFCDSLSDFKSIKLHSDIDNRILENPVSVQNHTLSDVWFNAYSQIALEIVMETTLYPDSFHLTEKTFRPIYFKRPFLIFGAYGYLEKLRTLGFRTFQSKIPNYYENFNLGIDQIFECLDKVYQKYNGDAAKLLHDCQDDIEHNYHLLLKLGNEHRSLFEKLGGLEYLGSK